VDATVPSPARIYDYALGGTLNYQADRDAVDKINAQIPEMADMASVSRGFHQRAARRIAQQGIRQFIDLGAGLPTYGNTHDVVQRVHPRNCVVYVDHDPIVLAYATELLAGNKDATLIQADIRDPDAVLANKELRSMIDFTEPAGLLMTGVLPFVSDAADPWGLVWRYLDALASGSYLAINHVSADVVSPKMVATIEEVYARASEHMHFRSKAEIERFFDGLDIMPPYEGARPGVTFVGLFDCEDPEASDDDSSHWFYCAVARRP
jgi:O-methyltransferase involved in polyketide biosynthesis